MATRVANVELIASYFESLSDPRHTRNRKHLFIDIVVIAVCGLELASRASLFTGCDQWDLRRPAPPSVRRAMFIECGY